MKSKVRLFGLLSLTGLMLAMVFIFQRFNYLEFFQHIFHISDPTWPYTSFVVNRTIRFLINDALCIFIIYLLFRERKYIRVAFLLFLVELLVLLPFYFWIKLSVEGDSEISSPMLSQIHRLIINPTLMMLLIVSFLYQKRKTGINTK